VSAGAAWNVLNTLVSTHVLSAALLSALSLATDGPETEGGTIVEAHEGGGADDREGRAAAPVRVRVAVDRGAGAPQGCQAVTSLADMACDVFESDEEMEKFIAFTYRCRREGLA
jgi:hypothetical protein